MVEIACPNCHARYQVPAEALGARGRDVTCSSCGQVWHAMPEPEGPVDVTQIGVQTAPPRRGQQMAEIRQMLDQVQGSGNRRAASPGEEDFGTARWGGRTEPAEPPRGRSAVHAAVFGHAREDMDDDAVERTESFLRDRLGSSGQSGRMKSVKGEGGRDAAATRKRLMGEHRRRHRRFEAAKKRGSGAGLTGFVLVMLVGAVLVGLYSLDDLIIARVPEAEPAMRDYVAAVDKLREEIQVQYVELRGMIEERLGSDEG